MPENNLKNKTEYLLECLNKEDMFILMDKAEIEVIIECINNEELDVNIRNKLIEETKRCIRSYGQEAENISGDLFYNIKTLALEIDNSGEFIRECILDDNLTLGFREFMAVTQSNEVIEEYLKSGIINLDSYFFVSYKLGKEKILELLNSDEMPPKLKIKLAEGYQASTNERLDQNTIIKIMELDGDEELEEIKTGFALKIEDTELASRYVKKIKNMSELTNEQIEKMGDVVAIVIEDPMSDTKIHSYSRKEYIAIREVLDKEILAGIELPVKGNFEGEFKAFSEICKRLSYHIKYNHEASRLIDDGISNSIVKNSQDAHGLIFGESVCAGYADILRNALSCVGIDCKYISGNPEKKEDSLRKEQIGHAWNQVNIGGQWFNVDLTWARDEIVRNNREVGFDILESDKGFIAHDKYSQHRPAYIEECKLPVAYMLYMDSNNMEREEDVNVEIVNQIVINESDKLSSDQIRELLLFMDDESVEVLFKSQNYKPEMFAWIQDKDKSFVQRILSDKDFYIDPRDRIIQIFATEDAEFIKECAANKELNFTLEQRCNLVKNCDNDYIKSRVLDGSFDELADEEFNNLIVSSRSIDFIKQCLHDGKYKINDKDIGRQLEELEMEISFYDEDFIKEWESRKDEVKEILEVKKRGREEIRINELDVSNRSEVVPAIEPDEIKSDTFMKQDEGKDFLKRIVKGGASIYKVATYQIQNTYKSILQIIKHSKDKESQMQEAIKGGVRDDRTEK